MTYFENNTDTSSNVSDPDLVAAVVSVYNMEPFLDRCVNSIVNQTYKDLLIVLVDDGSTDRCPEMCDAWAKKDGRIKVIHKENGGQSDAMNCGIDYVLNSTPAGWITIVDCDDYIEPQMIEFLHRAVVSDDTKISVCKYREPDDPSPAFIDDYIYCSDRMDTEEFYCIPGLSRVHVSVWAKLYAADIFRSGIRYPFGKQAQDQHTTHKLLFLYDKVSFVPLPLYLYTMNPDGLSRRSWTPKRIDCLEGIEQKMEWFGARGLHGAFHLSVIEYANTVYAQYIACKKSGKYDEYIGLLHDKLSAHVKKYRKSCRLTVREYPWLYEALYPRRMSIYWKIKGPLNKTKIVFRRVIKNER